MFSAKKITYGFFMISLFLVISIMILVVFSCRKNDILDRKQTVTFQKAKKNNINIEIQKEDVHVEVSTLFLFNVSNDTFVAIYNEKQIMIFTRKELVLFLDEFLKKRMTPIGDILWKYVELSKILLLPVLKFEKNMGKLIVNNCDYTQDLISYSNFCINFLAKNEVK